MKKFLAVLLALMMVLLSVSFSIASAEEWICPNCGKTNITNFCTSCGAKHDIWICPNCGTENSDAFCGNCGTEKPAEAQPETPVAAEPATEETSNVKAGDVITFGRYPQTAEGMDQTPIEWIVLDVRGGKALVISKYGLDTRPYNTERMDTTWETCTLRAWLNNEFLDKAFSPKEQSAILTTEVDNSSAQGYSRWDTDGGNNTQDKVFLLSYAEAHKYFGVEYWAVSGSDRNTAARVAPTEYAIQAGAFIKRDSQTADGKPAGYWWLRSPGDGQSRAADASGDGSLRSSSVHDARYVVRPAFWVNLESDIF